MVGKDPSTGQHAERGARVTSFDAMCRGYQVVVDGTDESCALNEDNLRELEKGTLVELTGLKARGELNGQGGLVQFFAKDSGRYSIKLDSGSVLSVKGENLLLPLPFYDQDASGGNRGL